jgi:hypothetical protein
MQKWEHLEVVAQFPNEEGTNVTRSGRYFILEKPWYVYLNERGDEGWAFRLTKIGERA